jgi:hypothetical protein
VRCLLADGTPPPKFDKLLVAVEGYDWGLSLSAGVVPMFPVTDAHVEKGTGSFIPSEAGHAHRIPGVVWLNLSHWVAHTDVANATGIKSWFRA